MAGKAGTSENKEIKLRRETRQEECLPAGRPWSDERNEWMDKEPPLSNKKK